MLGRVRRKNRVLPFVLLALLVAVNAYLISLLLLPDRGLVAEPGGQNMGQASPSGATPEASLRTATASPTPAASEQADVVPAKRLIVAASPLAAWRATVGDCKKAGTLEQSTDGGDTWNPVVEPGLAPIIRLGIEDSGDLYVVGGTGKNCSARYASYSTDGSMVAQTNNPQEVWFQDPADPNQVRGPDRAKATPCEDKDVVGIATLNPAEALIVCSNGAIMVTSDSGESWEQADKLAGAMAVGSGGGRYWVARTTKGCDGLSVTSLTLSEGELSRGPSGCSTSSDVTAEGVAIDVSKETIWLWAGDKVHTSTDGGQSWG
jgi:hypothetical protein